jgi:hypothetical protein
MKLTTKPISLYQQSNLRPEFIRLPKPGTADPWTSLSRSTLNLLVLPCKENGYRPPVRSCTLRRRGTMKGVRLIDFQSLIDHINSTVEPAYVPQMRPNVSTETMSGNTTAEEVKSGQEARIRIVVEVVS